MSSIQLSCHGTPALMGASLVTSLLESTSRLIQRLVGQQRTKGAGPELQTLIAILNELQESLGDFTKHLPKDTQSLANALVGAASGSFANLVATGKTPSRSQVQTTNRGWRLGFEATCGGPWLAVSRAPSKRMRLELALSHPSASRVDTLHTL